MHLVGRELDRPGIATTAVLDSLVGVMLIHLVRAWLPTRPPGPPGSWLGVLDDEVVHQAVRHIHTDPSYAWTTASLAAAASVSRATLHRRFTRALGLAPTAYLTRWRLDLAASRLRTTDEPIGTIAATSGYATLPAFSRAFTRTRGRTPAQYRAALGLTTRTSR